MSLHFQLLLKDFLTHFIWLCRIWERETHWVPRRWDTPKVAVESACWNTDATTLLFASGQMIYAVHFAMNPVEKFINENNSVAVPLYDISDCTVFSEDEQLEYKLVLYSLFLYIF